MMIMNCFCGKVDRRKAFSLISSQDHCQRFSPSWISDTPRAEFEPEQNLSSGLVEWTCTVVITTAPQRSGYKDIFYKNILTRKFFSRALMQTPIICPQCVIFKIAIGTRLLYWWSFNNFESGLMLQFCIPFLRSRHQRCSAKKDVTKNLGNFISKHLRYSFFLIKV